VTGAAAKQRMGAAEATGDSKGRWLKGAKAGSKAGRRLESLPHKRACLKIG